MRVEEQNSCRYCFDSEEPLEPIHKEWMVKDINVDQDWNLVCPYCWVRYGEYEYPYPQWWK